MNRGSAMLESFLLTSLNSCLFSQFCPYDPGSEKELLLPQRERFSSWSPPLYPESRNGNPNLLGVVKYSSVGNSRLAFLLRARLHERPKVYLKFRVCKRVCKRMMWAVIWVGQQEIIIRPQQSHRIWSIFATLCSNDHISPRKSKNIISILFPSLADPAG